MQIIKNRNSIRKFKPLEIKILEVQEILKEATTAPSAGNIKAYTAELIFNKERIKDLANLAHQSWIGEATLIVMVKDNPFKSMKKYGELGKIFAIQDATLFLAYFDLLCVEKGWGTCWVGGYNHKKIDALTMLVVGGK